MVWAWLHMAITREVKNGDARVPPSILVSMVGDVS